jgi:hypothetical protein
MRSLTAESTRRFAALRVAVGREEPGAIDAIAALAVQSVVGDQLLAASCAGLTVLVEHLRSAGYRHASRMLTVLDAIGPAAAAGSDEGLLAWAGAAIANDYGVLPSWPHADVAILMERVRTAPADIALALGAALGEVCERNGRDADFAALLAQLGGAESDGAAAPFWRGHWAIASAWHLVSFGRLDDAAARLELAQMLAAANGLYDLGATAALQRARLIESSRDPVRAMALANGAVARGDPARTPLWLADRDDVRCRLALHGGDFHAAVGHARRAVGHLQVADVWPGYQATYRVNEAYALLGAGAVDEALACFNAINETAMPRYLGARLRCLGDLATLSAADRRGQWNAECTDELADVLRRLRELEWPGVLPLLPQHVARLFARALASGIETDWIRASIRTRGLPAPPGAPQEWPWQVKVRSLGALQVTTESGPLRDAFGDPRKAASKPLELLRFLAGSGNEPVPLDVVAEALWPGDGREGRHKALDITTARLRRLLGGDAAVSVSDRRIRLSEQSVWSDVQTLHDCLAEGEAGALDSAAIATCVESALALYRGPCHAGLRQPWAVAASERIRSRLAALLLRAIRSPASSSSQRREWALRAAAADPLLASLLVPTSP